MRLVRLLLVGAQVGGETFDVFISCGHHDQAWVHTLAKNLHRAGLEVFLDAWEIAPGDVVVHQLERGLLGSRNGCWWSARRRSSGRGCSRSTRSWSVAPWKASSG